MIDSDLSDFNDNKPIELNLIDDSIDYFLLTSSLPMFMNGSEEAGPFHSSVSDSSLFLSSTISLTYY